MRRNTNGKYYLKYDLNGYPKFVLYSSVITIALIALCLVHNVELPIWLVIAEFGFLPAFITAVVIFTTFHYTIKNGNIYYHDRGRRTTEIMSDISAVIVVTGGRGRGFENVKTSSGKWIPCPYVALCSGNLSDLKAKRFPYELNVLNLYGLTKDTGVLTLHNLVYHKDLAEYLTTNFNGDLYIARSVYNPCVKEISEYYQKWTKDDKAIYIIEDKATV